MLLQKEDREFLEKIASVSKHDKSVVYDVMRALLFTYTLEIYKGIEKKDYKPKLTVPFLCNLEVDYEDEVTSKGVISRVKMNAVPQNALIDEINHICAQEETPSYKSIEKQLEEKFKKIIKGD